MPTRVIIVPEPLELKVPGAQTEEYSFQSFVQTLLSQPHWGKDYKAVRTGVSIENKVADAKPGSKIELAEADWELLRKSAETPENGFGLHPILLRQMLPFMDAVVQAEEA